jgi:hypothetical protein
VSAALLRYPKTGIQPEISMESIKEEVAPLLLLPESWEVPVVPAVLRIKTPLSNIKLKQSRYEDIWGEDVHAAFMEGRERILRQN